MGCVFAASLASIMITQRWSVRTDLNVLATNSCWTSRPFCHFCMCVSAAMGEAADCLRCGLKGKTNNTSLAPPESTSSLLLTCTQVEGCVWNLHVLPFLVSRVYSMSSAKQVKWWMDDQIKWDYGVLVCVTPHCHTCLLFFCYHSPLQMSYYYMRVHIC